MTLAEIRSDKGVVTLQAHEPMDRQGRVFFTMDWWSENFHEGPQWRAQCFRTDPQTHIDQAHKAGLAVRYISRSGQSQILAPGQSSWRDE